MRVAVISDMLRPNGANIMAAAGAAVLSRKGHDVVLLAGSRPDPAITDLVAEVPFHSFLNDDHVLDRTLGAERMELSYAVEAWIHSLLAQSRPDVVVCHNTGRILDQVSVARLSQTYPVGVVLHDEWFLTDQHYVTDPRAPGRPRYEPFRARTTREHDFSHLWHVPRAAGRLLAVAPSSWLQARWQQVFPTLPCALVHNPVDDAVFDLVDRNEARRELGIAGLDEVVGFVGDPANDRKGLDVLVEALATLEPARRPVLLVAGGTATEVGERVARRIDGGGLLAASLSRQGVVRKTLKDPDRIVIAGVPRQSFKHVYGSMDLLIHPSEIENLPTVPIEAQYCGTPVLLSDVGGSRDTVPHHTELFPPELSREELGRRIRATLDDKLTVTQQERKEHRERALQRFSPAAHYAQMMPVLEALTA